MTVPALIRAVEITDQLRSPGGCPWDAEQTHASLARYLLEEAYETLDALQSGDLVALREELGDLLFQVLFHARIAAEADSDQRFSIEEVAADLVEKLTRRHPHVFGSVTALDSAQVESNWDEIKRAEKGRASVTDGVPMGQPALSLTAALLRRSSKAGVLAAAPVDEGFGERLFALAAEAVAAGIDPELALRQTATGYAAALRSAESGVAEAGG